MAFFSGVSTAGLIDYGELNIESILTLFIWENTNQSSQPRRVGYFWYIRENSAAPMEHYLIERGAIYLPGSLIHLPGNEFVGGTTARVKIRWDIPGINFNVFF